MLHPAAQKQAPQTPQVEMPKYQSHKKVWALKIKACSVNKYDAKNELVVELSFHDKGYANVCVPAKTVYRYRPVDGDYYVVYEDGYTSISPAKAFEEGYTRL